MEDNEKIKFDNIIPEKASDDPKRIIKQDKKLFSILLISLIVLTLIGTLISIIAGFVQSDSAGIIAIFTGIAGAAVSILEIIILVAVAHNISRTTVAVLKIAEKLCGADKNNDKDSDEEE